MHVFVHGINNRDLEISKFSKSVKLLSHYDVISPEVAQNYGHLYKQLKNDHLAEKLYTGKYFGTRRTRKMLIFHKIQNP